MPRRFGAGALVSVAAGLVCAAPANAFWAETSTWKSGTGRVWFYAEPGEVNDVTAVSTSGQAALGVDVVIHDSKATVTPPPAGRGAGCTKVDDHTLQCANV